MSAEPHSHVHDHTHDHHHDSHAHAEPARRPAQAAATLSLSLLRLGLVERLAIAGGLVAAVWLMILGVLS